MNDNWHKIELIIKVSLTILFLGCLFSFPYGYYQLVRLLGTVGFGILAYNQYQKNQAWFIVWLSSAILINPVFKISLGRGLWNVIDIIWAILLITSMFFSRQK
ncbi:hypothetical protein FACS189438_1710 [Bacteroidia bacterium]|nr:hypothetical protein FACS189438_1710 [Bacteroidia bacterium]